MKIMFDFTLIITHCQNQDYLHHFLDIVKKVPVLSSAKIWVDGWCSAYKGSQAINKVTSHNLQHGERSFDLLNEADTDKVIIVDSDFFSTDENLWSDTLNSLDNYDLISISEPWHCLTTFPTTPFVAYNRKKVIEVIPVRDAWRSFGSIWPRIKFPVFDHCKYAYLSLYLQNKIKCIDTWRPVENRKYKFFHFWDSRHDYAENFKAFEEKQGFFEHEYLSYGINKCVFDYIVHGLEMPDKIWNYMDRVKKYNVVHFNNIFDMMLNLGFQIEFKNEWHKRFEIIRNEFNQRCKNH